MADHATADAQRYLYDPPEQSDLASKADYSAPRKQYRATVEIVLSYDIAIARGKELLVEAAASSGIFKGVPKPDVRAVSYDAAGVRYDVRYWVPSFVDEVDFRDAILVAVDAAIREQGIAPPFRLAKFVEPGLKGGERAVANQAA